MTPSTAKSPQELRQRARVLVVEDDDAMRDLLVEELTDIGFSVLSAPDGRAGVDVVLNTPIDLIITDLRMPDVDGFDLIRDVKATRQAPHIVMITAFGSIETAIKAVKLGAYDYITKPFEIEELVLVADKALKDRELHKHIEHLQREVEGKYRFGNIIGESKAMQEVLNLVTRISTSDAFVLITGESGTGKELIARAIHYNSPRASNPFVAVNLAAVPAQLLESELFGHKKGAFTGAHSDRPGLFREANGGTLFLDEIGELAPDLQAKLLRVLQEGEMRPVGASQVEQVEVRVVAATNRDLEEMMAQGDFREDLYYRLNVIDVRLPPLRNRADDILPIAEHLLRAYKNKTGREIVLSSEAQRSLLGYRWPGNVRELQNAIERGIALSRDNVISPDDLPKQVHESHDVDYLAGAVTRRLSLAELERDFILLVLDDEGGNKTRTAQRLGLDRKTLYRKLEEFTRDADKESS
jgi:two-component system response regulator HydG